MTVGTRAPRTDRLLICPVSPGSMLDNGADPRKAAPPFFTAGVGGIHDAVHAVSGIGFPDDHNDRRPPDAEYRIVVSRDRTDGVRRWIRPGARSARSFRAAARIEWAPTRSARPGTPCRAIGSLTTPASLTVTPVLRPCAARLAHRPFPRAVTAHVSDGRGHWTRHGGRSVRCDSCALGTAHDSGSQTRQNVWPTGSR